MIYLECQASLAFAMSAIIKLEAQLKVWLPPSC